MAMIDLNRIIQNSNLKLLLQVHDELIFEGTDAEIEENLSAIKFKMENEFFQKKNSFNEYVFKFY
jgi:DNA polymerase I-like protein with 3'-5' exonuclease and polymerase domains